MIKVIKGWFHRYFSDPQAVFLAILLLAIFTILMTMSEMLAPVLVSVVIAYLLEGLVRGLQRGHLPRALAVFLIYSTFLVLYFAVVMLLPWLSIQYEDLITKLPTDIEEGRKLLVAALPERFQFISEAVNDIIDLIRSKAKDISQTILSYSLASIPVVIVLVVYSILVPLLVFFFLKDKEKIFKWFADFLPNEHSVVKEIWIEMDAQMGNYVRGKVYEIFLVGTFTYFIFAYLGLKYALLLAVLVGLSVIIPYVGVVIVTFPVVIVAFFQWQSGDSNFGASSFYWVVSAYFIIQALDGNVLVPLLFSEAVNLHPVAIIVAVLVFGGFWGVWGVFFAIPLATLVKALLSAWPRTHAEEGH